MTPDERCAGSLGWLFLWVPPPLSLDYVYRPARSEVSVLITNPDLFLLLLFLFLIVLVLLLFILMADTVHYLSLSFFYFIISRSIDVPFLLFICLFIFIVSENLQSYSVAGIFASAYRGYEKIKLYKYLKPASSLLCYKSLKHTNFNFQIRSHSWHMVADPQIFLVIKIVVIKM